MLRCSQLRASHTLAVIGLFECAMPTGQLTQIYYKTPGPGSYVHEQDQKGGAKLGDAPSYSMSSRAGIVTTGEVSPGPMYAPHHISARGEGPMGDTGLQYGFGSDLRFPFDGSLGPGPGMYPIGGSMGTSIKVRAHKAESCISSKQLCLCP